MPAPHSYLSMIKKIISRDFSQLNPKLTADLQEARAALDFLGMSHDHIVVAGEGRRRRIGVLLKRSIIVKAGKWWVKSWNDNYIFTVCVNGPEMGLAKSILAFRERTGDVGYPSQRDRAWNAAMISAEMLERLRQLVVVMGEADQRETT